MRETQDLNFIQKEGKNVNKNSIIYIYIIYVGHVGLRGFVNLMT